MRSTGLAAFACAVLVAGVAAGPSNGLVEDRHGNAVPGASADGSLRPHHFDLMFKTVLCVPALARRRRRRRRRRHPPALL